MNAKMICCAAACVLALGLGAADAQLSKLLREGAKAVGKGASKGAAKGAAKTAGKAAGAQAKIAAKAAGRGGSVAGGRATVVLSNRFGAAGVRAASRLSDDAATKLAALSDELAATGRQADWLTTIAKHGDEAVSFLWKHKGSIAVGAGATAVVLAPEDFLHASERFASGTVASVGEHLVEPLIAESAEHLVEPAAKAATTFFGLVAWFCIGSAAALAVWHVGRRQKDSRRD